MVNVGNGYVLPYATVLLMKKLRVTLYDARSKFGDVELNKILLRFIEPEV